MNTAEPPKSGQTARIELTKIFERALARADSASEVRIVLKNEFPFISDEHLDFLEKEGGIEKLRQLYYQVIRFDLKYGTKTSHFIAAETLQQTAQDRPELFAAPDAAEHTVRHRSGQTASIENALRICAHRLEDKGLSGKAKLFDMGCGTAKILIVAMDQNGPYAEAFRSAVGIDYYSPVLKIAAENLKVPNVNVDPHKVSLQFADAADYTDFNGVNVVVAYNPFDATVMKEVERNLRRVAGKVLFAYIKPLHAELFGADKGWTVLETVESADPDHRIAVFEHGFS